VRYRIVVICRPKRSGPRWSWGGRAGLVALLLVVQGLASLHVALVPHRRCAEHGELVEGVVAAGGDVAVPVERSQASSRDGDSPGTHDDHDRHCLLCTLRAPSAGGPEIGTVSLPVMEPARPPEGTDRPKTSIAVFAIAPKSSPPAGSPKAA